MSLSPAWAALRHGGNLLSPAALDGLPTHERAPGHLADRLRSAIVDLPAEGAASGEALSALLDVVLVSLCGLPVGWRKGSHVGAADARKLLDGTVIKPRRIFDAPESERLAVFTTPVSRVGVGAGRRPVAQVVEYLRRSGVPFGLLTNGREWRLIWADADALAWVEWDADRWLAAEVLSDELEVLRRVLSAPSLGQRASAGSALLTAIRDTRRGQAKLSKELGERVRQGVETLLRARAPVLAPAWDDHAATDLYVAACHIVMRLVVVLFAEARELLPVDSPIYHQAYSLRGLLDQLDRIPRERRRARQAAWPRLVALFRLLHGGSWHEAMLVQAYGGELFKAGDPNGDGVQRAIALLESMRSSPDDEAIHHMLDRLTRTMVRLHQGGPMVPAPVDFTELTSEYIGILYEGLLDYELRKAGDDPVVFLNLGDQPALPLDRLEGMDDKALAALVEKAKVKKAAEAADEDGEGDDDEASGEEEPGEDEEPSSVATVETPELLLDDTRAAARTRAEAWGRRAAVVGKLVKKGKPNDPAYQRQLDTAAQQLIADVKLPGELFLVRWGGTRKGAGTFYTRPQLTMPTVRRTLEPLLYTVTPGVEGGPEVRTVRTPEEILALKVCDPAMGSGSFLVAALRTLTAALVEALHVHGRITQVNGRTVVTCEPFPEDDRSLPTEGFDDRLDALVRRAIVEHCLYGVDRDPLAVELGRVAPWVETLDRRLPFTFLDHKLRCGDALVGTWLDRFRDYPLLAFDRESPDKKWKGVHHVADTWHDALKERRAVVIAEQATLLGAQAKLFPGTSDEELKAAVARVRRLYRELRAVPAGMPHERARIWRERIQTDPALTQVRTAFDTWCALWFWPLDRIGLAPGPRDLHAASDTARGVVSEVCGRLRFFHWELEFPDVFTEEGAGFHAVVGNPPWEIQKPSSKEFFSNHDPLYRAYGKQEAVGVQKRMFADRAAIEDGWLAYTGDFKDRGNFIRYVGEPFGDGKVAGHDGGDVALGHGANGAALHRTWRGRRAKFTGTADPAHPFRHQGSADLNTYKMFVEVGHALLRRGGQIGMIMPSGLYTDKGTGDLRKLLLRGCDWRWLYGFENRARIFDIHRSFKFCVCIAEKGGKTEAIQAAFMRHDLQDWAEAKAALAYPSERVAGFSPNSLSVLELRSAQDLLVLTKLYSNGVPLGDQGLDGWGITYAREFDMTGDSKLFPIRDAWEEDGFKPDNLGRWVHEDGRVSLPLYEGRMIGAFDFSEKGWVEGKGRSALWRELAWAEKSVEPQYLMARDVWRKALASSDGEKARLAGVKVTFMAIGSATNRRSMFAALVRDVPCGNAVPVLQPKSGVPGCLAMAAAMNSFAYDFALRLRLGGLNLNYFVIAETALLPTVTTSGPIPRLVALLSFAHPWFSPSWLDLREKRSHAAAPP